MGWKLIYVSKRFPGVSTRLSNFRTIRSCWYPISISRLRDFAISECQSDIMGGNRNVSKYISEIYVHFTRFRRPFWWYVITENIIYIIPSKIILQTQRHLFPHCIWRKALHWKSLQTEVYRRFGIKKVLTPHSQTFCFVSNHSCFRNVYKI